MPSGNPKTEDLSIAAGGDSSPSVATRTTLSPGDQDASSAASILSNSAAEPMPCVRGYEIECVLGRGGMGVVYKARHLGLKRPVALKMILSAEHAGEDERCRFRIEAESIAKLQHPNIVGVYDIGEEQGKPYFALEFVAGGSLAAKVRGEPQPPREAAMLIEVLARAMHFAHQHGVVHRDLKPANVLLQKGEGQGTTGAAAVGLSALVPKISDFGLAKSLDNDSARTRSGAILGTPSYMSPEQAMGENQAIGPATDVYALGAMLYELLTGRPPFRGATVLDTLELVWSQEPVAPGRLVPKLPRDIETICLKCLEKQSARRYGSAASLADDLRRFIDDRPIVARPTSRWERLRKFTRRNKLLVGSTLVVTLALVLGIIGTSVGLVRASQAQRIAVANRDRAIEAERQTRRDLARSYWDNGRLAAGHGQWREAIKLYDKALDAGLEDEVEVRLLKLKAWLALHEVKLARAEIAELAGHPDLGDRESILLLLRADLDLGGVTGQEEALADVRRALDLGLPPDDAEYARALLSDWPREAVQHLRNALTLNPAHPDARQLLLPMLMSLGRLDECKEEIRTLLALFPEDPTPKFSQALLYVLDGDADKAAAQIRETEAQLGKERAAIILQVATIFHDMLSAATMTDDRRSTPNMLPRLLELTARWRQFEEQQDSILDYRAVNLPAFARVWKPLSAALTAYTVGEFPDELAEKLDEVVAHHPEGVAQFLHALANVAQAAPKKGPDILPYMRKAELSFRLAMDGPCTLPAIRHSARYWAAYSEALLARPRADIAPPDPEMRRLALANMQRLLADGGLSADSWANLAEQASTRLDDHDLARLLVTAGERQAPGDVGLLHLRARIELAAGAYSNALAAANKVLAILPEDAEALRIKKEATDKLRELAP